MWGSYGTHLKGVFGQLPLYLHCSRSLGYHMGPTCTSAFGQLPHCHHYSRYRMDRGYRGYRVELHMRPAWTSVWGRVHTIVTRSDPSGTMRLHMGQPKEFFSVSSCTILTPVGPQAAFRSPLWFT